MTLFFDFVPIAINDVPFLFLNQKAALDCLDRKRSVVTYFKSDPARIMEVKKYCFTQGAIIDPLVFPLPDTNYGLYATQTVKKAVEKARLRGVYFLDT